MAISKEELEEVEKVEDNSFAKPPAVEVEDLDKLLSDYKQKYKESEVIIDSESEPQTGDVTGNAPATATPNADPNAWKGNPAYFQTGKKAGQLRPNMQHKAPPPEQMTISGSLIDAGMFLMLIDMIFPLLIQVANNKFNSETKIKVEDLQMTDKQKRDLEPIAEQVIKQMSISADPKWLLLGSLLGIYGINYMAVISGANEKKK